MNKTKTLIGITGNIATGKSVVRRMLVNAGALGLDADVIAHRVIYPQGPAFKAVVEAFGSSILDNNGEIDRARLGEIVFQDPEALARLEAIVHPAVTDALHKRLDQAECSLAALEAIKLIEAGLGKICNAVWVAHTPPEVQLERLIRTRGLSQSEAQTRISAQPPQNKKLEQADWVIHTDGAFQRTWKQVSDALNDTIQQKDLGTSPAQARETADPCAYDLPHDELLGFLKSHAGASITSLYEALGLGMVQPLLNKGRLEAILLWEEWNFTASLTQVLPSKALLADMANVMEAYRTAAQRQGCELLMLDNELLSGFDLNPGVLGYEQAGPADLGYPAWRAAVQKIKGPAQESVWVRVLTEPLEADGNFLLK
jgi:dephospho-CoA kinase